MPKFSKTSLSRLITCDERLQRVAHEAIKGYDFVVVCGFRNKKDQEKAYKEGFSTLQWPDSRHNAFPSQAMDLAPWVDGAIPWNDLAKFDELAGHVLRVARDLKIGIEWGGNFKRPDRPHFQLREEAMPTASEYKTKLRPLYDTSLNNLCATLPGQTAAQTDEPAVASSVKLANATLKVLSGGGPVPVPMPIPVPAPTPIPGPTPTPTPSGPLDFKGWNITGDVDANGGFTGTAKMFYPVKEVLPFCKFNGDGTYTLTARVDGARTSANTKYARSELRELKNNDADKADWNPGAGRHQIEQTFTILQRPIKANGSVGRQVVCQIHGIDDELCRVYDSNGVFSFVNDKTDSGEREFLLFDAAGKKSNVPLGDVIDAFINVQDKFITVGIIHNGVTYSSRQPIGSFWHEGEKCYFKSGVYLGVCRMGAGSNEGPSKLPNGSPNQGSVKFFGVTKYSHS